MSKSPYDGLQSVLADAGSAHGLPNPHYVSDVVFAKESKAVLFDNWTGVGFTSDVPNPGDVRPVNLLGMPLLLVRTYDGEIKVFQNTCRHRGMLLVQKPGNVRKVVRCPYHSWCYDLHGKLQVTPHVGGPGCNQHESINPEQLGLHQIDCAHWLGVIFVNISAKAPPFDQYSAKLQQRWCEFGDLEIHGDPDSTFTLQVRTNWKLAVENYCESYHLPWVHPGLNSYSKLEDHYNIEQPDSFSGQGSLVYRQLRTADGQTLEDLGSLSESWDTGSEYIALYPNVLLGVHRDHTFAIVLEPQSTHETVERVALFYSKESANNIAYKKLREENKDLWKAVFEEDIFVVEGMQSGRQGVLFDGGVFSPIMDSPTHNFHRWVANQLLAATPTYGNQSLQG
ncbi:MAG: aromatic ring-hydroxylating dioxygenase subunit alpha [Granulosicoccus sp.]|nr:aromatic ring-hydroxylating dioxygenase subunit alpha [Granulosicoccus sp.]